jgi:hypothetical protein
MMIYLLRSGGSGPGLQVVHGECHTGKTEISLGALYSQLLAAEARLDL